MHGMLVRLYVKFPNVRCMVFGLSGSGVSMTNDVIGKVLIYSDRSNRQSFNMVILTLQLVVGYIFMWKDT